MHHIRKTTWSTESALAALVIACCVLLLTIASYQCFLYPIDYDEAYNLQVVDLLVKSKEYASYGALKGEGPWLFDPYITTGPAILGPLAFIWALSDGNIMSVRAFMLTFLWAYVLGWYCLVKGSKTSLTLVALVLAASLFVTNMQVGRVLGELPAAAAAVWAAWAISRDKPLIAAVIAGIAIQIKLVYGLAGLVMLLIFLFFKFTIRYNIKIQTALFSGVLFIIPSVLFEALRFISFEKLESYRNSVGQLRYFLATQNINNSGVWHGTNLLGEKLSSLYHATPYFSWVAIGIAAALIVFGSALKLAFEHERSERDVPNNTPIAHPAPDSLRLVALAGLVIAGSAMLGGWITQSTQSGARQALPFLFLAIPALLALGGYHYLELRRIARPAMLNNLLFKVGILCWFGLLLAALYFNGSYSLNGQWAIASLEEQRRVVNIIKKERPKSIFVDGWWQNPEYQLLASVPGLPFITGSGQMLIIQDYQVNFSNTTWDTHKNKCARQVYSSDRTLVCWLPDSEPLRHDIQVLDWGPRSTIAGVIPNMQLDQGAGIWIKIKKIDISNIGPVHVYFSGKPTRLNYMHVDGEVITTSVPRDYFSTPGQHEVTIKLSASGQNAHVGYFSVK